MLSYDKDNFYGTLVRYPIYKLEKYYYKLMYCTITVLLREERKRDSLTRIESTYVIKMLNNLK